jgi:DNA primase
MELGTCNIPNAEDLGTMRKELGLVSDSDNFLLNDRYIIPVEDIEGGIVALIGYFPDYKKYITTPAPFFSKEFMFFNFKQAYELSWAKYDGFVIVVEGIFDCLSLRAIGLPAMATMGSSVSKAKGELLKLFKKVLAIPDDDKTGHNAINRYSPRGWQVPQNTTMLRFHGGEFALANGETVHCKDMDNFVSWYNMDDVREILLSFASSKEEIEDLYL